MIFQIVISIISGILFGIFTGLIPGVHTNLISIILISTLPILLIYFSPIALVYFVFTMAITNIFIEFIPAIFLGAPEEDTALSILPAHELLLQGKANTAIFLSSLGATLGIILSIPISFFLLNYLNIIYPLFERMMFFILVWVSIFSIFESKQKILTLVFFFMAGIFGIASLNININQPLFPILTGLFGTSSIIFSIKQNTQIPEQQQEIEKPKKSEIFKPIISGSIIAPVCSFLPGLGSSQATIIGSKILKNQTRQQFIILNGLINSVVTITAITALFILNKTRTGSASAISKITEISTQNIYGFLVVAIFLSPLLFSITIFISKKISNQINKINYTKISKTILFFLFLITILISGLTGILILTTGTLIGLSAQYYGIRKSILMGCLLIPTMIFYFPV